MKHQKIQIKTDFFGQKWYKIFTCTGRKLVKLAPVAALLIILNSCGSTQPTNSWEVYCQMYGVDSNNPTEQEENYYLDCWVGNDECEVAMSWNEFSKYYVLDPKAPTTREIADFVLAWRGKEAMEE